MGRPYDTLSSSEPSRATAELEASASASASTAGDGSTTRALAGRVRFLNMMGRVDGRG